MAEYDFAHDKFDTDWRRSQVQIRDQSEGEGLELRLQPHDGGINRFAGGSIRRENSSHYGCYEVRMQAASHPGVVTGFFTYTGPHYGTRHDEIDIEFLGRNTRQMHVAWFIDGQLQNHFVDLGFDAAEKMVDYAFEWRPERLRWFVNGALVFERHAKDGAIPAVPGRLFVNLWAADPSISNWAGTTMPGTQAKARVAHVRFTPLNARLHTAIDGSGSTAKNSVADAGTCQLRDFEISNR
ncbi:family 16 glycosylhydrolase [uncultured Litoreibacter sp.]|uniref:family 16 glycosylhydrolase n=1 Tax=uncultured Litoreibacter sp. TaxID=1392394 RepID=UPI002621C9EF|nr:family 16 glycosylhydrolase [uncultured Litoreibacter sp.]